MNVPALPLSQRSMAAFSHRSVRGDFPTRIVLTRTSWGSHLARTNQQMPPEGSRSSGFGCQRISGAYDFAL